jgi:hypothetical protein
LNPQEMRLPYFLGIFYNTIYNQEFTNLKKGLVFKFI